MLVIDRKGEAHPLPFGIKSADELLKFIQPFLDEAMYNQQCSVEARAFRRVRSSLNEA